jgi:predicted nuclease with TOPRIM domain
MSVVGDVRTPLQDFLAPELRELKTRLDSVEKQLDRLEGKVDAGFARIDRLDAKIDNRLDRLENLLNLNQRVSEVEARLRKE